MTPSSRREQRAANAVAAGRTAVSKAQNLREALRRNSTPGSKDREQQLDSALDEIDSAMYPIRSFLGRLPFVDLPDELEEDIRQTSKDCQYERRQLKKMQRRDPDA